MEVHQHSHTARKKWHHYFWEFFMLFLAITLGFLVENWREHRVEHKRAAEYARMLRFDLMNDTFQLGSFILKKDSLQNEFVRIQSVFEKKHDSVTFGDFYFIKNCGINLSVFIANDATYTQMKSSGSLRYFSNVQLLGGIGFYDSHLKRFENNWNTIKTFYGGLGSDYLLRYSVISGRFLKDNSGQNPNRILQSAGYNFEAWDEAGKIIVNIMGGMVSFHEYDYPDLKEAAAKIISLLNKEYHLK